jgi:hypothetical protein
MLPCVFVHDTQRTPDAERLGDPGGAKAQPPMASWKCLPGETTGHLPCGIRNSIASHCAALLIVS